LQAIEVVHALLKQAGENALEISHFELLTKEVTKVYENHTQRYKK
jgi:hypothetical protein